MMRIPLLIFVLLSAAKLATAAVDGFGPWRFGMSKEDVTSVTQFGPYTPVRSTGGVETLNAIWNNRKTNTSFVFSGGGLAKIQIWAYEGKDVEKALNAWCEVAEFLRVSFGPIDIQGQSVPTDSAMIREAMRKVLSETANDLVVKIQMGPQAMPPDAGVFCSFFRHPEHGFYVFLYFTKA